MCNQSKKLWEIENILQDMFHDMWDYTNSKIFTFCSVEQHMEWWVKSILSKIVLNIFKWIAANFKHLVRLFWKRCFHFQSLTQYFSICILNKVFHSHFQNDLAIFNFKMSLSVFSFKPFFPFAYFQQIYTF